MVTRNALLKVLPPFGNNSIVIEKNQEIGDIVREVIDAHKYFAGDYNNIYDFFDTGNTLETCKLLFDFCKGNVAYEIESENNQTTKSPAAILVTGKGDCKHYAGFIGGVLSAINRNTTANIKWCYCFASYSLFDNDVSHVFVIVKDRGNEIWIDPVLCCFDSRSAVPVYKIEKKVDMLQRISGVGNVQLVVPFSDKFLPSAAITKTIAVPEDISNSISDQDNTITPGHIVDALQLLMYEGVLQSDGVLNLDTFLRVYKNLNTDSDKSTLFNSLVDFYDYTKSVSLPSGSAIGDIWTTIISTVGTIATAIAGGSKTNTNGVTTDQLIAILNAQKSQQPSISTYLPIILIGGGLLVFLMMKK